MKMSTSRLILSGGLILASFAVIFVLFVSASNSQTASVQPASTVTITVRDMHFDLDATTAKVGQPITIQLKNEDIMDHAFAIDALNVGTDYVQPNEATSITFTPQQVGTYQFRCPFPGHDKLGMVGTFQVIP